MAGTTNAPRPPPLSPATVDRHVASPAPAAGRPRARGVGFKVGRHDGRYVGAAAARAIELGGAAAARADRASGAPPLADGASGRWAMAQTGTPEDSTLLSPDGHARDAAAPDAGLRRGRRAGARAGEARRGRQQRRRRAGARRGGVARDRRARPSLDDVHRRPDAGRRTALAGARSQMRRRRRPRPRGGAAQPPHRKRPTARSRRRAARSLQWSRARPRRRTRAPARSHYLGDASRDLGRAPAASALALALQSALFADDARVRVEARTAAQCGLVEVARSV